MTTVSSLNVVGESGYLNRQASRYSRLAALFPAFSMAFLGVSLLGWLAFILRVEFFNEAVFLMLLVVTILALIAPVWGRQLEREAGNYLAGERGESLFAQFLQQNLNSDWTLYRSASIDGYGGDIDGILAGPTGLFALEIKSYVGHYRNSGMRWQRRTGERGWQPSPFNPSRQAHRNTERLNQWLTQRELGVVAQPRVVWAGDGIILREEPTVPIWHLGESVELLGDLVGQDVPVVLDNLHLKQLNDLLTELVI